MRARIADESARFPTGTQAAGTRGTGARPAGPAPQVGYVAAVRVAEIWRYPVKSLGGERLAEADVRATGIDGDRAWGVLDPATGLILTARREPALLFLSAIHHPGERPAIRCDDGTELPDDDALSRWIGRPVVLRAAADGPGTFENPMSVDEATGDETDWFQWQSAGQTFHDGRSTVSFVSRASLGEWDARRFRANLVLDEGADEDALTGEVRVGGAVLAVRKPIDRCVMVTRAQPGLPRDVTVLKRVIAERGKRLAVGATVATAGRIAEGDTFG